MLGDLETDGTIEVKVGLTGKDNILKVKVLVKVKISDKVKEAEGKIYTVLIVKRKGTL